jgi:hypothetical protein
MKRLLSTLVMTLALVATGLVAVPAQAGAAPSTALACGNYEAQHIWHPDSALNPGDCFGIATGELVMQHDGNLVLYRYGKSPCASNTNGWNGARAYFQYDGNLVIDYFGYVVKTSRTSGYYNARLRLRETPGGAILDIRAITGSSVWHICNPGFFNN